MQQFGRINQLIRNLQRYVRAFTGAVRMTVKGEKPAAPRYPELQAWARTGLEQLDEVFQAAEKGGLTREKRQTIMLVADGRRISMEMVLKSVQYHLAEEYPHLIQDDTGYSRMAIFNSNMNDEYRLRRLIENLNEQPDLTARSVIELLETLRLHLHAFPESAESDTGKVQT